MQTYKLINNKTKEETICNLVTINGFDYYVEDREPTASHALLDNCYYIFNNKLYKRKYSHHVDCKLVLCTNNSNIDIPKVIDEVNIIIKNAFYDKKGDFKRSTIGADDWINGLKLGYNKAKETYQFTEEDIIEFAQYVLDNISYNNDKLKEMLFTWKKQQIKTIYYE